MADLDERVALLAKTPRVIYETSSDTDRALGDALELVLGQSEEHFTADFFDYDWSKGTREKEAFRLREIFPLTDQTTLPDFYREMVSALVREGYFVEEREDSNAVLLQPLLTDANVVNGRAENYIGILKKGNSPLLRPPKVANSQDAYTAWLVRYHELNGMNLPKDFYQKTKVQLQGMFNGINSPERIEKRLRENQFVIEFYKAHYAMLPTGFEQRGDKRINGLYKKLMYRYSGDTGPQLGLFKR